MQGCRKVLMSAGGFTRVKLIYMANVQFVSGRSRGPWSPWPPASHTDILAIYITMPRS